MDTRAGLSRLAARYEREGAFGAGVSGAAQHGGRREITRELRNALTRRDGYRDSREELTPAAGDPLAAVPVVLTAAITLARPAAWRRPTGGSTGAYSLTPAAWHALAASGAAGASAPDTWPGRGAGTTARSG